MKITKMNSDNQLQTKSKWWIMLSVMTGVIMGPIDGSIVNVVLPEIAKYFHADYSIAQWVPTIYLLAICSLILVYGKLGDMVGYKKVFLIGLACFGVASLLCGFSSNIWMLIVLRAIQGMAVAMQMALGLAIVISAFPAKERGKATGFYATGIAMGLMLGPVLGGIIANYLNWRYVFFVNVPISVIALIWGGIVIPSTKKKSEQHLDFLGAAFAFIFLFSIVFYANRSRAWGWLSVNSLALLASAVIFFGLFIYTERKLSQPMINLSIFSNTRFSFACLSALISFMAQFSLVFLTPWYLADALGHNVLTIGLVMIGSPLATFFVGPISGILSDRIGVRGLAFFGMMINAVGLMLLSQMNASTENFEVFWRLVLCGFGWGMFQSPLNSAIMGSVPAKHRGIASSILAVMRNIGMAFGIAIAGSIVYNLAPIITTVRGELFTGATLNDFLNGLHWAYAAGAGLSVLAAITALMAKSPQKL